MLLLSPGVPACHPPPQPARGLGDPKGHHREGCMGLSRPSFPAASVPTDWAGLGPDTADVQEYRGEAGQTERRARPLPRAAVGSPAPRPTPQASWLPPPPPQTRIIIAPPSRSCSPMKNNQERITRHTITKVWKHPNVPQLVVPPCSGMIPPPTQIGSDDTCHSMCEPGKHAKRKKPVMTLRSQVCETSGINKPMETESGCQGLQFGGLE